MSLSYIPVDFSLVEFGDEGMSTHHSTFCHHRRFVSFGIKQQVSLKGSTSLTSQYQSSFDRSWIFIEMSPSSSSTHPFLPRPENYCSDEQLVGRADAFVKEEQLLRAARLLRLVVNPAALSESHRKLLCNADIIEYVEKNMSGPC
jgi:hypothetical protein